MANREQEHRGAGEAGKKGAAPGTQHGQESGKQGQHSQSGGDHRQQGGGHGASPGQQGGSGTFANDRERASEAGKKGGQR